MSEASVVAASQVPLTRSALVAQLRACGVSAGQLLLVHSSLSSLGWVAGGAVTVIHALLDALGAAGTLMMPTHTADNSDPANWRAPPVPEEWWPVLRAELPAFDPQRTPSRGMGCIAEAFRSWPGTLRSAHPIGSFAAQGPLAAAILADDSDLAQLFGEASPIGQLYRHGGHVLLLGVGHDSNTSLHLAEHRARIWRPTLQEGAAMYKEGARQWVPFTMAGLETDDFPTLGAAFEAANDVTPARVGNADVRLLPMRALVDFAVPWLEEHRPAAAND